MQMQMTDKQPVSVRIFSFLFAYEMLFVQAIVNLKENYFVTIFLFIKSYI